MVHLEGAVLLITVHFVGISLLVVVTFFIFLNVAIQSSILTYQVNLYGTGTGTHAAPKCLFSLCPRM
jgi:hypothetical protein